jgi:hypothetical protein
MKSLNENKARAGLLVELSLKGLANLYDENQGLFAFYIKDGKKFPMPLSWSICYTAITLLGLNKVDFSEFQGSRGFDKKKVLYSLISNRKGGNQFGHLGLIQWANAECKGQYSKEITDEIAKRSSVDKLLQLPTTELAWLLTGICSTYRNLLNEDVLKDLALHYFKALTNNFNPQTGLFRHTATKVGHLDLRSHIGNFADQIYSVFALSSFYEVFGDRQALAYATQCADCLCSLQGDLGQWWWHYHSSRGIVGSPYPVFSVHQDGMGPMGLQKLSMVSGKDYQAPIYKGLYWLFGSNELGLEIIDWDRNLIWRDIELSSLAYITRYISILLVETGLTKSIRQMNSEYSLRLNREIRPYELGWLLYAFAGLSDK